MLFGLINLVIEFSDEVCKGLYIEADFFLATVVLLSHSCYYVLFNWRKFVLHVIYFEVKFGTLNQIFETNFINKPHFF
jgi:hypothetical protein